MNAKPSLEGIRDVDIGCYHHHSPQRLDFPTLVTNLFVAGITSPALGVTAVMKGVLWLVDIRAVIARFTIAGITSPTLGVAIVLK